MNQGKTKSKLPVKIKEVVKLSKIDDKGKAELIASNYAPFMGQVTEQIKALKKLDPENPKHADKARRIKLDCGKICARSTEQKRLDKSLLSVQIKFIDALHNTVEGAARITQAEAEGIEKHFENIEKERLENLDESRRQELEEFGVNMPIGSLSIMTEQVWSAFLEGNRSQHEAKEREKLAAEEREEAERVEAERIETLEDERNLHLDNHSVSNYFIQHHELTIGELTDDEYKFKFKQAVDDKEYDDQKQAEIKEENERLKLAAKEREEKEKKERLTKEARTKELQPYIQFIRDYNKLILSSDAAYKKELKDIIRGANDHWNFEREEKEKKDKEHEELEAKLEVLRKQKQQIADKLRKKEEAEQQAETDRLAKVESMLKMGDIAKVRELVKSLDSLKSMYDFKAKKNIKKYKGVCELIDKVIAYIEK